MRKTARTNPISEADQTGVIRRERSQRRSVQGPRAEGGGEELVEGRGDLVGAVADAEDGAAGAEFVDDLAAGAAGGGGGEGRGVDEDRPDGDRAGGGGDHLEEGVTLGAGGQTVRSVLDVATGVDRPLLGQDGRADAEVAVRDVSSGRGKRRGLAAARFTVDVVLPTPPFWLSTAIRRMSFSSLNVCAQARPSGSPSSNRCRRLIRRFRGIRACRSGRDLNPVPVVR